MEVPFLLAGVRCTVRYLVFPLVLPLTRAAGEIATGAAVGVLLILDLAAAISIAVTLRRLWRQRHPRRWRYLLLASALAVTVGFFTLNDAAAWFA